LTFVSLFAFEGLAGAEPEAIVTTPTVVPSQGTRRPRVLIVPLGNGLSASELDFIDLCLLAFYDFELLRFSRTPLPKSAFYAPRQRYRAEKLLSFLDQIAPKDVDRIVGLTTVDISTTKDEVFDWGVLGLATVDGRACVLSNKRCERGTRTLKERRIRFGKVAVHEVGHTLGLPHCPTLGCLMEDAKGSVLTTDREYDLCEQCRNKLAVMGRGARSDRSLPWPQPTLSRTSEQHDGLSAK
jgi:archaemetzincin